MEEIVISPEYKKLIEEVQKLKEKVAILYEEKHQLIYHECKNIEAEYMQKVGTLEYKAYEFQCKVLRLKRKIELYQVYVNRQEEIDEQAVEEKIDEEYKEYEEKLRRMADELKEALDRVNGLILSKEDSEELKKIYRRLIKKLHPDLNPNATQKDIELLVQVTKAYGNGDLLTLKNLELLVSEISDEKFELNEFEELKKMQERYENIIKEILERIREIKQNFPYNQRDFLKDDKQIEEKKKELNELIEMYKEVYKELSEILNKMRGKA